MTKTNFDSVPAELRALNQWVVWRYEEVRDKQGSAKRTKVPYNAPKSGLAGRT